MSGLVCVLLSVELLKEKQYWRDTNIPTMTWRWYSLKNYFKSNKVFWVTANFTANMSDVNKYLKVSENIKHLNKVLHSVSH